MGLKDQGGGKAVDAHLRYLERDGVDRDGQEGRPTRPLRTKLTARLSSSAVEKIGISSALSWRPKIP